MSRNLFIHLHEPLRSDAEAGRMNLFNRIAAALPGWRVRYLALDPAGTGQVPAHDGYSIWWMMTPPVPGGLTLRKAYWYPFWRLERHNERWDFEVVHKPFDPGAIDPDAARRFATQLRSRVLPAPGPVTREGFLFMPLQGRISRHRSFQSMSPLRMIEATLAQDPRPIRASLHPSEQYDRADHAALDALTRRFARFQVSDQPSMQLLAACDGVVTQNSTVALTGALLDKPAVLFAGIDFHHVFGSVPRDGIGAAFERFHAPLPAFERYLYWFLQEESLNAGRPDFEARLRARLQALGWATGP